MSRESFVFLLGFVVFFTPFLGIPRDWKEWIFIVSGVLLMFFGYKLRRASFLRSIMQVNGEHRGDAFVEGARVTTTQSAEGEKGSES